MRMVADKRKIPFGATVKAPLPLTFRRRAVPAPDRPSQTAEARALVVRLLARHLLSRKGSVLKHAA